MPQVATLSGVNLDLIRLFVRVAATGNITTAAREIGITASLASRRIAALERTLNVRLFQRTTRRVRTTEAGQSVLPWAQQTLEQFNILQDALSTLTEEPRGLIRVVVNHHTANTYLPAVLTRFCETHPEIALSIATSDALVNLIDSGFDLAVYSGWVPPSSLVGIRLRNIRRILCASPSYLQTRDKPLHVQDLSKHDCLVHTSPGPLNWCFRSGAQILSHPVHARIETDSYALLLELVRNGLGIARLSCNIVRADLQAGRLVQLLPEFECVDTSSEPPALWLLYPNRRMLYRTRLLKDYLVKNLVPESA